MKAIEIINSTGLNYLSKKHLKSGNDQNNLSNEDTQNNNQINTEQILKSCTDIQGTAVIDESDVETSPITSSSIYSIINYDGPLDINKVLFMKQMKVTYDVDDIDPLSYCEYKKIDDTSSKLICTHLNSIPVKIILKSISNIISRKVLKEPLLLKIIQNNDLKTIVKVMNNYPEEKYTIEEKLIIND